MASKGTAYSEEQIIRILKEVESGTNVAEVCRWRSKYGGLDTSELHRLRELEVENTQLKKIVAQQVLDINALLSPSMSAAALALKYRFIAATISLLLLRAAHR